MNFTVNILRIFSAPFILFSRGLEKLFSHKSKSTLSVDNLSQALEMTSDEMDQADDKRILEGIVSFGKTEAKQVMTPRTEMFTISDDCPFERLKRLIVKQGYSRIPVYHENPDHITGVLYIKDLLAYLGEKDFLWQDLLREPFFVPENRKIDDILVDFQEKKNHLAVVVDEYGGTSGIISMDDILEEIVGNISDEFVTRKYRTPRATMRILHSKAACRLRTFTVYWNWTTRPKKCSRTIKATPTRWPDSCSK